MPRPEPSPSENRRSLYRAVRGVLATGFLLFAMATYYVYQQYGETKPSFLPDPDSTQLRALATQNWTVYLTRADQFRLYALGLAAAACLVAAVALDLFILPKREDE